jgi:hypothetical protein
MRNVDRQAPARPGTRRWSAVRGAALAALLAWPAAARAGGETQGEPPAGSDDGGVRLEQRTELLDELTADRAAPSLLNPGRRVFRDDGFVNRLRLRTHLSAKLGGFALKGRGVAELVHEGGERGELSAALPELYAHRSLWGFELSAGRKILRWSNGYAFAPAGLLDPARDPADPQDRLGRFEGRDVVQLDWYRGNHTLTAVAGRGGTLPDASEADRPVVALRYHVLVRGLELSLMGARRPHEKDAAAASLSYVVGSPLEIHAEAVATRGSDVLLPRSILPGQQQALFGGSYHAPLRDDARRLFVRWLVGVNYTLPGGLNLVVEYFHAPDRLSREEWQRFLAQARFSAGQLDSGRFPPVFGGRSLPELDLLQAMQGLGRPGLGRDYVFVRLAHSRLLRRVEASALALVNVRDGSLVGVPEVTVALQRRVSAYARATWFAGDEESEFGNVPIGAAGALGLRLSF